MSKKIAKNNQGVTLVELVIAVMLLSIITASVSAVFLPILRLQRRSVEVAELNALMDNIANPIINDLSYTYEIPAWQDPDTGDFIVINKVNSLDNEDLEGPAFGENTLAISLVNKYDVIYSVDEDGILRRNGVDVLPPRFYLGRSIRITCSEYDSNDPEYSKTRTAYQIELELREQQNGTWLTTTTRTYAVWPIMLNQYGP